MKYTHEDRKQLEAIVSPDQYAIYNKKLHELKKELPKQRPPFSNETIILPYFLSFYDQDDPKYQDIPIGKVGNVKTSGILPVIAMDLIEFYGNPLNITLKDLCDIVEERHYRAYVKNPDGSLKLTPDGNPIGNGIRWSFNDKVLPWAGVKTKMTASWQHVINNLKQGHPSIAILKNKDEVIIKGIDRYFFYVVHGNKRTDNSFGEQIFIPELTKQVEAIWLCKGIL